jgi:hypothetical protein
VIGVMKIDGWQHFSMAIASYCWWAGASWYIGWRDFWRGLERAYGSFAWYW